MCCGYWIVRVNVVGVATIVPVAASVPDTVTVYVPFEAIVEIPAPAVLVLPQPDNAKPPNAIAAITTSPRSFRFLRPANPTASNPAIVRPVGKVAPGCVGKLFEAVAVPDLTNDWAPDGQLVEFV